MKTLQDGLDYINKSIKEGKSEIETLAVASSVFGLNAGKVGVTLAVASEKVGEYEERIRSSGGALQDLIDQQLTSMDAQIKILDSSYEKFVLSLDNGNGKISKLFNNVIWLGQDFFNTLSNLNASGDEFYRWGQNAAKLELGKSLKKDVDSLNISVEEAAKRKLPELVSSLDEYKTKLNELTLKQREAWIDGGDLGRAITSQNIKHTQKAIGKYEEMIALAKEAAGLLAERPQFIGPVQKPQQEEPFSLFGGGGGSSSDSQGMDAATESGRTYAKVLEDIKNQKELLADSTAEEADQILDTIDKLEKEKEAWERSNKSKKESKKIAEGSIDAIKQQIDKLEDERDRLAQTTKARENYNQKIKELQLLLDKMENGDKAILDMEGSISSEPIKKSIEYFEKLIAKAEEAQKKITDPKAYKELEKQIKKLKKSIEDLKGETATFEGFELDLGKGLENDFIFKGMKNLSSILGQNMEDLVMEFSSQYEWDYKEFLKWSKKKIEQSEEEAEAKKMSVADWMEFAGDAVYQIGSLAMAFSERKIQKYEEEIQKNNENYENWLANENLTEAERKQMEKEREQKEKELTEKKRKEQEKQAKIDKATAAFQIAINTAAAVVKALPNIPLSIAIGALGTIQLATVLAKPIPKYKTGRKNGPAEIAEVGDGGKSEVVTDSRGRFKYFTPNKSTYTFLDKGDRVEPDANKWLQGMSMEDLNRASIMTSLADQHQRLSMAEAANKFNEQLISDAIYKGYAKVKPEAPEAPDYGRLAAEMAKIMKFEKRRDV